MTLRTAHLALRRRGVVGALAAGLLLGATGCGAAEETSTGTAQEGTIRVATTSDSKPYTYVEDGEYTGFDIEVLRAAAERLELEPEFIAQEFSAVLPSVANGQADVGVASIAITEERQETVDFTDPYFVGYIAVLTSLDSGVTDDPASLAGRRLGLVQGTIQDEYAQQNFDAEIVRFPDNNTAVSALQSGTIDAHFLDFPPAEDYAAASGGAFGVPISIPVPDFPAAMAVRKGNTALLDALNGEIAAMVEDGTWLGIAQEYFPNQPVPEEFQPSGSVG